jgi:S1-C subfamily serine protease
MDGKITPPKSPTPPNRGIVHSKKRRLAASNPNFAAFLIVASILVFAGLLIVGGGNSSSSGTDGSSPLSTVVQTDTVELAPGIETVSGVNVIKSIVLVVAQDSGDDCAYGSGSVIVDSNYVLTNFHVVEDDENCDIDKIFIETIERIDLAPVRTHTAEIFAINEEADLVILKIKPLSASGPDLVPVEIAPEVRLGDELTAIGFPAIGGESVTVTKGEISGFSNYGGVRWIKSSISISGGNSGGGAFNVNGELVGVPTSMGVPGIDETTDCRPDRDTNGDGEIDSDDECVSMGGFINSLSPGSGAIELAKSKGLNP